MRKGSGLYKVPPLFDREPVVWVKDHSITFEIYESLYRQRGYEPSFDDLPTQARRPERVNG